MSVATATAIVATVERHLFHRVRDCLCFDGLFCCYVP